MIVTAVRNDPTEFVKENYTFRDVAWCCDKMRWEWLSNKVGFGHFMAQTVQTKAIITMLAFGGFGERGSEIWHCPYCGAKIDIQIKERA